MSSLTYEDYYQQALEDLAFIWKEDVNVTKVRVAAGGRPRYEQLLQYWVSLYIQYLRTAKRLATVHDAQLQPQKRYDVRTLLDTCLGRMLELRNLLTVNCGEFVKLDDAMLDTKMIPDDLEVPIPRYFVEDAASELQERRRQITALQAHYKETEVNAPVSKALTKGTEKGPYSQASAGMTTTIMTVDDAVKLLQVNERGRQARQRAKFQMVIYLQQKHALEHANEYSYTAGKERAALVVQKAVQAYLARKHILNEHNKELELLGMRPTAATLSDAERVAAGVRLEERKARQRMNEANYRQKEVELEARLKAEEGPRTMEEMLNEVLTRMAYARMESKDDTPLTFPTPEEGGSRKYLEIYGGTAGAATGTVIASGAPSRSPPSFPGLPPDEANVRSRMGSVTVRSSFAGTALPQTPSRKAGSTIRRRGEGEESLPAMPPSNLWNSMNAVDERYQTIWRPHFEQTYLKDLDLDQAADERLLRHQLLEGPRGILENVRCVVDELIMIEVENLKKRLEMERRGGKKKKGGKKKGPKKPRAPKLKDPTKGVDIETFMNSAVHQNVLQLPDPDIRLENYLGCATVHGSPLDVLLRTQKPDEELKKTWQRILNNWDANVEQAMKMKKDAFQKLFDKFLQQSSWLSEPSAAQVRQCVAEYAILPLGSQVIHDLAPTSKTLLLYGFSGSGKTHLVHAVCNHSGANLFDLSPANFETNTNLVGIIQMVFHLARVLAPSVIYIDKVEKLFLRKKKKKGPKDPLMARGKKMKKEILKGIAALAPTDRVLVIGSSSAPWDAEFNAMVNNFAHMIHCVTPDYASRLILLKKWVAQRTTDANALKPEGYHELALLTDGLSAGEIQRIVCEVLHTRRLRRLAQRPLTASDFLSAVAHAKPPSGEEQALMKEFSLRLPLRLRRINPSTDLPAPEKKEGGTKKKKKEVKE
ncbi:IQ motif containing with AAA domain 1 [Trypanosoma rangeli]|uniref:IQ motif containing with AAA domain 1 n=1 Tax=Trypanosoma rangeli TaxID=5698 RepID=A0A422P4A2_TRYRA|nr:IQ motif containing with AAA domain 1 [Trypanosoma rangeli]RNF12541.1 IQ motif containing with AAA domain 1 [Trypanosoma rangeli]|eukprot:RNF12541.1 IQ motif containing with AAA domain 1 [Trypanosoma rangeli]